ncbi:leucyl aminopeptidase [bacterium]|nr:MAG: leucyl aminopeptidase [bacterium]
MNFSYAKETSENVKADALVIPAFESDNPLKDYACGLAVGKLFLKGDFTGKSGQIMVLPAQGAVKADRVILLGLGKVEKACGKVIADALADVYRHGSIDAQKIKTLAVATEVAGEPEAVKARDLGRAIADAAIFGSYRFLNHHTKDKHVKRVWVEKTIIAGVPAKHLAEVKTGQERGAVVATYTCHARDLVNEPSNFMKPRHLAKFAKDMAAKIPGLKCRVLEKPELEKLKMGSFLGVNAGSADPARLIILEWNGGKKGDKPLAYVGKGLCFDTGGYNIKPNSLGMKGDMGGGAATICALGAIAALKLPINAVGVVPATENEISGTAYHPGDILHSMSGQTIEVDNTDAEGRLILCDALTYTQRNYKPRVVVDMATLTGAAVVAVGSKFVAMMGNDAETIEHFEHAFNRVGENVWELPLPDCYDKLLDSPVADMKNIGGNPGTITAGLFLRRFVDEGQKWVHLDIAGSALYDGDNWGLWNAKSPTGSPVRALVEYAEHCFANPGHKLDSEHGHKHGDGHLHKH